MLDQESFDMLALSQKVSYLHNKGTWLITRQLELFDLRLFYLNNYFVEAYYSIPNFKCELIISFLNTTLLIPYLEGIRLNLEF